MKRLHLAAAFLLAAASGCREDGTTTLTEGQSYPRPRSRAAWESGYTPGGGAQRIGGPCPTWKEGTGASESADPALPQPEPTTPGPRVWHATCGESGLRPVARQRAATLPSGREAGRSLRGERIARADPLDFRQRRVAAAVADEDDLVVVRKPTMTRVNSECKVRMLRASL